MENQNSLLDPSYTVEVVPVDSYLQYNNMPLDHSNLQLSFSGGNITVLLQPSKVIGQGVGELLPPPENPILVNQHDHAYSNPVHDGTVDENRTETCSTTGCSEPDSTNVNLVSSTTGVDDVLAVRTDQYEDFKNTSNFYCVKCLFTYANQTECWFHVAPDWIIPDSPVQSQAVQSLPSQFKLSSSSTDPSKMGVWTNVCVFKKTRFEQLQGERIEEDGESSADLWKVFNEDGSHSHMLSVSNEASSNWLMFVREATTSEEQNLAVGIIDDGLWFITTRDIAPNTELLYWFTPGYAKLLGYPTKPEDATCTYCSTRILDTVQILQHKLKAHVIDSKKDRIRGDDGKLQVKSWLCVMCDKQFHSSSVLQTHHLTTHFSLKTFKCLVCKKGFSNASNLKNHSSIHTGQRRFSCKTCGGKFRMKSHLESHELKHSNEKPFKCKFCEKFFKRKTDVKQHEAAIHLKEETFNCSLCKKVFYLQQALTKHMVIHSDHRPHVCHKCSKSFPKKYSLDRHIPICRPKPYQKNLKSRATEDT